MTEIPPNTDRYATARMPTRRQQVARFLMTGASNTILTFAIYEGLVFFVSINVAYTVSFLFGLLFVSTLNTSYVFGGPARFSAYAIYGIYYIGYFSVNLVLLNQVVLRLGVSPHAAPLLVLPVVLPIHFVVSRLLTRALSDRARRANTGQGPRSV